MNRNRLLMMLIPVLILTLVFAGCGKDKEKASSENKKTKKETSSEEKKKKKDKDSGDNADAEKVIEEMPEPASFDFTTVFDGEKATEKAVLTAYDKDNKELWKYETEEYHLSELDCILDIGVVGEGYCFIAGGTVYRICTMGSSAGHIDWSNEDFQGAGASCYVDYRDELNPVMYICGYYGPDLFVIDSNGDELNRYDTIDFSDVSDTYEDGEFYWASGMNFEDGYPVIWFYSNSTRVYVDPDTGKALEVVQVEFDEDVYESMRMDIHGGTNVDLDRFRAFGDDMGGELAIAYLGYVSDYYETTLDDVFSNAESDYSNVEFMTNLSDYKYLDFEGGSVFMLVPVYETATMTIYEPMFNEYGDLIRGDAMYESKPGEIVIVSGDFSDIAPNIEVIIEDDGEEYSTYVTLSMMDGRVQMGEGIVDFSIYED